MRVLRSEREITGFLQVLRKRAVGAHPEVERIVKGILEDVRENGDQAVRKYTRELDRHELTLRITAAEIKREAMKADGRVARALKVSAARIKRFHERQREKSWSFRQNEVVLGQIIRPLERVGVYVPGGKASYPSTVLMDVIPAQVAGVKEIALCVPTPLGEVSQNVMAAIDLLGVREVYRIGGAQAIAAMAYGTASIRRVDKIVGPGNIYVATAKRMVFGDVDIDMIAGPSEILILADETAPPSFVAADMLSQAEHDEMASSILVTDSEDLITAVLKELDVQMKALRRRDIARKSLRRYGAFIKTKNRQDAIRIANEIGPEHLEIMTGKPERDVPFIKNAGAIFLGQWTPEPLGDYSAGPNHTLPTAGTARFSSPLGVYDFIKRTSLLQFDKKGFMRLSGTVETLADEEGLEAHGNTIRIRRDSLQQKQK